MDETSVREHAQQHGQAVVARDFDRAGSDLTGDAETQAPHVMRQLPRPTISSEIVGVEPRGEDVMCLIRYSGQEDAKTVASTWREVDGTPRIVELTVLD